MKGFIHSNCASHPFPFFFRFARASEACKPLSLAGRAGHNHRSARFRLRVGSCFYARVWAGVPKQSESESRQKDHGPVVNRRVHRMAETLMRSNTLSVVIRRQQRHYYSQQHAESQQHNGSPNFSPNCYIGRRITPQFN